MTRSITETTKIIIYTKEIPPELKKGSKVIGTKAVPINCPAVVKPAKAPLLSLDNVWL